MIRHKDAFHRSAAVAAIVAVTLFAPAGARAEEAGDDPAAAEETAGAESPATDEAATERARELFRQGVALADERSWQEAADRFEQALELRDAPTIRYNLAAALAQLDRPSDAADHLDTVLASEETTDDLRTSAQELLAEVTARTAGVTVTAEGFEGGASFALDGEGLGPEQLGSPIRVDPGSHVATATVAGEEVARAEAEVAAGETGTLALEAPRTAVEEAIVDGPGGDEEGVPLVQDWRLWLGVAVGTAVIVTAVALGVGLGTNPPLEDPVSGNMDPGVLVWR